VASGSLSALKSRRSGLGLRRGDARVIAHDAHWAELYADLELELANALDGLAPQIEHIGSTAVEGLWAKPILDVGVALPAGFDVAEVSARLERFGLEYVQDLGDFGGLLFAASSSPDVVVLHVHVVARSNFQWRRYLSFRDALRTRRELAEEYSSVKRALAAAHPVDRPSYLAGKSEWVVHTIDRVDPGSVPHTA
jgi:GrpB-like predicted nucleotidyltransferase (UPF0157 family)